MTNDHSINSSFREKLIEHLFIGEILKALWLKGISNVEVSIPQVDNAGYDVVMEVGTIIRHIQLKSSFKGSTTPRQKINLGLATKPSGSVIWVYFDQETLELGPFLWFGSSPGNPLPNISNLPIAKHTKGNAEGIKKERPNLRVLNKGNFKKLDSINEVLINLFGNIKMK